MKLLERIKNFLNRFFQPADVFCPVCGSELIKKEFVAKYFDSTTGEEKKISIWAKHCPTLTIFFDTSANKWSPIGRQNSHYLKDLRPDLLIEAFLNY